MPRVKVGDIDIHYELHGDGEAIVLISGYGGSSEGWLRQIPDLSHQYCVVAFDNRGTGQSDKPDSLYSMEMMAGDVAGLLDAIDVDAAYIFGVSMGGMIAQEFALRYPGKVIGLILGCTTPGGAHAARPEPESMAYLFDAERHKRLTPEQAAWESLPFLFTQEFIDQNPELVERVIAGRLKYPTPLYVFRSQGNAIMGHDTYDRLPQIQAPTLVMAGSADRLVPVENSRTIAARIPNAELVILDNAGHGFPVEAAEEANIAVLDFLKRHPRTEDSPAHS